MAIPDNIKAWLEKAFGERVRFDEPMSRHTSFRIGGPADALVFPETGEELVLLVRTAAEAGVPWIVIGGGTNLLVKDQGIRGIVITTARQKMETRMVPADERKVRVHASGGTKLSTVCRFARSNRLSGMNFALGIPGTVGGAIAMNAGTAGGSIQDVLLAVEYITSDGSLKTARKADFRFAYRSFAIAEAGERPVIVEAVFGLVPGDPAVIEAEAEEALARRAMTQPSGAGNAGCFFRNPSPQEPAGKLIDQAGLKGYRIGGAVVSPKHANYIVNSGSATAEDVLALSRMIQDTVFRKFQVRLEPEVRIVE